MTPPTRERWEALYREEFAHIYRALVVVLRDRERALDALHDAFLEGLSHPPKEDTNLPIRTVTAHAADRSPTSQLQP
jgi:predicted RNA polymerase sigma factor